MPFTHSLIHVFNKFSERSLPHFFVTIFECFAVREMLPTEQTKKASPILQERPLLSAAVPS